jgi:uncharacterized protein YjaZ
MSNDRSLAGWARVIEASGTASHSPDIQHYDWTDANAMYTYRTAPHDTERHKSAARYIFARLDGLTAERARAQENGAG